MMAGKEEVSEFSLEKVSFKSGGPEYGGLEAIERHCSELYPDQSNPLQATSLVKFWMGGSDPLDYISMYCNHGDDRHGIPPHWHYITYGFSDLYGDGRVHQVSEMGESSGFGFELTFRLKRVDNEHTAPMWPSVLLNKLAKYVFQTGNIMHAGDHIPWHRSLDETVDSKIRHLLITVDPELAPLSTSHGTLEFRQVVGVTDDEVQVAQKWKGSAVLDLLPTHQQVGKYYITDISRYKSLFDVKPELKEFVKEGIERDGSSLGHVTAICTWNKPAFNITAPSSSQIMKNPGDHDSDGCEMHSLDAVVLRFDEEAAGLLPLIVKSRLKKGRFFIFHSASNHTIHLVPESQRHEHVVVSRDEPLMSQDNYLQIFCSHQLMDQMAIEFESLQNSPQIDNQPPLEFKFSDPSILIQVFGKGQLQ